MNNDAFDNLLRTWGYFFGPRRAELEAGAGLYGACTLASIGRPPKRDTTVNMDRGGLHRRRLMGGSAGMVDENGRARLLPAWAVDPVQFAETRTGCAKILASSDGIPDQAARVERSVLELHRTSPDLAGVVRAEYCTLGRQADKARTFGIERKAYRERLAEARGWLKCNLARAA